MKYLWLLSLIVLVGCENKIIVPSTSTQPAKIVKEKELTDVDKVSLLRSEAKKRGLNWKVFCVPKTDFMDQHYQASATQAGVPYETAYIEDGGKDWWAAAANTPAEAAFELYKAIQGAPTQHADHQPGYVINPDDCNYQTVLDNKHESNIPCKKGL